MTSERRRGAIYARISRDREGAGLGVARQEQECRELAERLGADVLRVFSDNDLSAYSGKRRPQYVALLEAIKQGTIDVVIVWHSDRLHRSPVELEGYIAACEAAGVATHTAKSGPIDLATPSGRMTARVLGAVARHESEHRSERVSSARRQRVVSGGWGGGVRPFGWQSDGITLDQAEAVEIVRATEALLAGASVRSIVADLNRRGVRTTLRKQWSTEGLRKVLKRPRNAGLLVHQGEIVGPASWPAVVPEESWRAVVALLEDPARRTAPGNTITWLGSHLYLCGTCRQPSLVCTMSSPQVGRRRPTYRCRAPKDGGTARHVSRDAHLVDRLVSETVIARLERPDAADLLTDPSTGVDRAALRTESLALTQRMDEVAEAFAAGDITGSQLRAATEKLKRRLAEVETTLAVAGTPSPLDTIVGTDVRATWGALDVSRRRALVDALMVVTVLPAAGGSGFDPASIDITWKT